MDNKSTQPVPPKLYKYQKYDLQTLENLHCRRLWFSDPEKFNDPYDPAPLCPSELSDNDLRGLFELLRKKGLITDEGNYFTNGKPSEQFKMVADEIISKDWAGFETTMFGISCFSAINNDLLLWAHYADGHRGFCLEFDTLHIPLNTAHKVVYTQSYPLINLVELIKGNEPSMKNLNLEKLLLTKSKHWEYEQEWRIFYDKNSEFVVDTHVLTGVYFGIAMPRTHKEMITQILKDSPTLCYEMTKSKSEYRIEPHLLTD